MQTIVKITNTETLEERIFINTEIELQRKVSSINLYNYYQMHVGGHYFNLTYKEYVEVKRILLQGSKMLELEYYQDETTKIKEGVMHEWLHV